jgi:hypothetical protein
LFISSDTIGSVEGFEMEMLSTLLLLLSSSPPRVGVEAAATPTTTATTTATATATAGIKKQGVRGSPEVVPCL